MAAVNIAEMTEVRLARLESDVAHSLVRVGRARARRSEELPNERPEDYGSQ